MEEVRLCSLCPRACLVDRRRERGACGCGETLRVARAAPHFWEEPCLSGKNGSGTVFFSGCNLRCIFCQNRPISSGYEGLDISVERLSEIFLELQSAGVHNINLVTPTPWADKIKAALNRAWKNGLFLPVIYNSGGYERVETLRALRGDISIYLPDFKYMDEALAERLSGAADYPEQAKRALAEMMEQRGRAVFDRDGMMTRGVLVRHLVLPGHSDDSVKFLDYLRAEYRDDIWVSIMNQYTPMPGMKGELANRLSVEEYRAVTDYALSIGFKNGFFQEGEAAAESFVPEWNGLGVLSPRQSGA